MNLTLNPIIAELVGLGTGVVVLVIGLVMGSYIGTTLNNTYPLNESAVSQALIASGMSLFSQIMTWAGLLITVIFASFAIAQVKGSLQ